VLLLSLITACNHQNADEDKFVGFAHHENMNNELRESLFKCLNAIKIEYKVDNDKNVLIKKRTSTLQLLIVHKFL
jgi:hypothetical protein